MYIICFFGARREVSSFFILQWEWKGHLDLFAEGESKRDYNLVYSLSIVFASKHIYAQYDTNSIVTM